MTSTETERGEAWFTALFREHHGHVRAYVLRRLPDEADDVVAEVFAAVWRHPNRVPDEPLPWLYGIAARQLARHRTRAWRQRREPTSDLGSTPDFSDAVADSVVAAPVVAAALSRLSTHDAEILRLWAWEQLTPTQIAVVLGISANAARVRLFRAKGRVSALLSLAPDPAPEEARR